MQDVEATFPPDRRSLLRGAGAAALTGAMGGGALSSAFAAPARRRSPNEELRVAVVGVRGRGRNHIDGFRRIADVKVVALVDVDTAILAREAKRFEERGETVDTYVDLREALERDDIDVISIASPNHWHALQAIWSCQAGKHVYCEKPVSHDVWEGAQIVAAARKYGRIVQTGTQSRSSHAIRDAVAWLQGGGLGRIRVARGLCYKPRKSIGKVDGPVEPPASVDYDLWLGPAPKVPLQRRNLHYDWHWDFDTGNGDLGNQGIHQMDIARWALGVDGFPRRVRSVGARLGYDDDANTPNTMVSVFEYDEAPLVFEVRGLPRDKAAQTENWGGGMDSFLGARIGVLIHCENGVLRIPNYTSAAAVDVNGRILREWRGADDHYANFVDAVRAGDPAMLNADIAEGHLSSALCHLGNISYQLGSPANGADAGSELASNVAASEAFVRMRSHLAANEVDLDGEALLLGPSLAMDPATESFLENERANALLAKDYRAPFVVPAEV